jgi:arylsulfatase A-like enzyme
MAHAPIRLLAAGLCLPFTLPACGGPRPPDGPRLVLLYATCTLNKAYLSPYDASVGYTPNLAQLAAEGVTFERHQTEAGQSGTAFASIFAGAQADRHGVFDHPTWLADDAYLVSEAFAARGYETWFWSGHKAASARLNYGQAIPPAHVVSGGFDDRERISGNEQRMDDLLTGLARDPARRAFVQINFSVTHGPYDHVSGTADVLAFLRRHPEQDRGLSLEEFERARTLYEQNRLELQWDFDATVARLGLAPDEIERLARALELVYATSVEELDRLFGKLLDRLRTTGLYDDALIAFTADHGEVLYRENALFKWTHGAQLAPEDIGVPLVVRDRATAAAPQAGARRYAAVTRSIDVFPTLMGLAGLPLAGDERARVDGVDLSAALRGQASAPELRAFSHTCTVNEVALEQVEAWSLLRSVSPRDDPTLLWTAVRDGDRWAKLARKDGVWRLEVYDLAADPHETRDLHDVARPEHAALRADLEAYRARLAAAYHARPERNGAPESLEHGRLKVLRDLGYVK